MQQGEGIKDIAAFAKGSQFAFLRTAQKMGGQESPKDGFSRGND
jgi:hypothetical protein